MVYPLKPTKSFQIADPSSRQNTLYARIFSNSSALPPQIHKPPPLLMKTWLNPPSTRFYNWCFHSNLNLLRCSQQNLHLLDDLPIQSHIFHGDCHFPPQINHDQPRRITFPEAHSSCTGPTRTPKASQRSQRLRSFCKLSRWPLFLPSLGILTNQFQDERIGVFGLGEYTTQSELRLEGLIINNHDGSY